MYKVGQSVKLINSTLSGTIVKIIKKSNSTEYTVNINNINLTLPEEKLEISLTNYKKPNLNKIQKAVTFNLTKNILSNEIMLRHQNELEAISNLEIFIDTAICNNISTIKIIHGKNGGILRNAVHEFLKSHPLVLNFHIGYYHEGSFGVTIANLKNH